MSTSESAGVTVTVNDRWQISNMPEDKQYFCLDTNLYDAALSAIKTRLGEKDTNIRNTWLLTEVDHWDLEKERVILLSDNNIISVKYNFILGNVEELRFIPLSHVLEMVVGEFKYPSSYGFSRSNCRGLKIFWGKEDAGILERWNPFSSKIPHTIFTSHILVRRKKVTDRADLDIDSAIVEIEKAVLDYRSAHGNTSEFGVKDGDLVNNSLLGISAMVHNGSNLGFNKRRGAANW